MKDEDEVIWISGFIPLADFFNSVPDAEPSLTLLNVSSDEVALLLETS